jgi:hypothetical protein
MEQVVKDGDVVLKKRNLERAGNKCELCNSTYQLDNHHLLPKSIYPQWRFEKMNTAILCRFRCHNLAENHPTDFANAIQMKANFTQRIMWVNEHTGIGKYPTEINYGEMYDELMRDE